jgi:hypothetical protein
MSVQISSFGAAVATHLATEFSTPSVEQYQERKRVIDAWLNYVNRAQGPLNAFLALEKVTGRKLDIAEMQILSPKARMEQLAFEINSFNQMMLLEFIRLTEAKPVAKL